MDDVKIVEGIIKEIDRETEKINLDKTILFKRISTVFMFIFLVPLCFLIKYFIEQSQDFLSWQNFLTLCTALFTIALYLIAIIIMIGNQFDELMSLNQRELLLVRRYLCDVKYSCYKRPSMIKMSSFFE